MKTVLLLSISFLASCASVVSPGAGLVGKWRYADGPQVCQYEFHNGGRFTGYVAADGAMISSFTGKWSLRDGAILYEYTSDKLGNIAVGTRDRDKLIETAPDYFVIEARDGSRRRYSRIE